MSCVIARNFAQPIPHHASPNSIVVSEMKFHAQKEFWGPFPEMRRVACLMEEVDEFACFGGRQAELAQSTNYIYITAIFIYVHFPETSFLHTPLKINMDPQNHWLVEENHLPQDQCSSGFCEFSGVKLFVQLKSLERRTSSSPSVSRVFRSPSPLGPT